MNKIQVSELEKRMPSPNSLALIREAARTYYELMRKNIRPFSKTGKLYNEWKFEIYSPTDASIYTNLVYARIQDLGGRIPITRKMRNFAMRQYIATGNRMWLAIAITKRKTIRMPAKKYSNVNLNKVKEAVEKKYPVK